MIGVTAERTVTHDMPPIGLLAVERSLFRKRVEGCDKPGGGNAAKDIG